MSISGITPRRLAWARLERIKTDNRLVRGTRLSRRRKPRIPALGFVGSNYLVGAVLVPVIGREGGGGFGAVQVASALSAGAFAPPSQAAKCPAPSTSIMVFGSR